MSYLDELAKIPPISREVYGDDFDNKPNDHCVWQNISCTTNVHMAWVETDEHLRERIKREFV